MPPVVAAVAAFVASVGVSTAIALAVSVAAAAYSIFAAKKAQQSSDTSAGERSQTFRSANAPKQIILGELEVSGPMVLAMEEGSPGDDGKGEILHLVIPVAGHQCNDCLAVRVGELEFSKIKDTAEGSYWRYTSGGTTHGQVWYYSRPDNATGVPASLAGVSQWSDDMIGRGQTFLHARLRSDPEQWPSGVEDVVARVQGAPVYDPRTGKTAYSTNPVLQALFYIRNFLQVPEDFILKDTFITAANICDEMVTRGGVTERRYSCHAVCDEDTDPTDVLGQIASSMAGEFIRSGGLWGARAGAYYGPATRTLELSECIEDLSVRVSIPLDDRVNTITGQYAEPEENYNETDFPSISVAEYIKEDGRERIKDMKYDYVHSSTQAQALAWIELEKMRRGATVSGTFKFSAVDAVVARVVRINLPGIDELEFRVIAWNLDPSGGIKLELQEDHPDIWTGQPGKIVPPLLPGELPNSDPRLVPAPTNLGFTRTPEALNQHGVLSWKGTGAEYEVALLDGADLLWKQKTRALVMPLTFPVADQAYTAEICAINGFGIRSTPASASVSLTLTAPEVTTKVINTRDHWLEVDWNANGADSYELELMTQAGAGVYRTHVKGAPHRLGWFLPGDYRLRVRALLGITPSAWSDEISLQIDNLKAPTPVFMPESKDPTTTGGMLSFSGRDLRTERIEYEVSGPGFIHSGDCPGTPVRMPAMLPAVYQFRARAQWRDVFSPWQNMSQQLSENLKVPADLTFVAGDDPGLWGLLSWESAASQHRVTITRNADNSMPVQTIVTGNQYSVPVLTVGSYKAEVIALGRVEESEPAIITLTLAPPSAPANLIFKAFNDDATNAGEVVWEPEPRSSGYQVRLLDQARSILVESKTTDNRWLIAPLTPGDYEVQVATISQRESATSDWSNVVFTLSGLETPQGLTATETLIGSGIQIISQVAISCEPVAGAVSYEFEYQRIGQGSWSGIQSGPAVSATLNAIPAGGYTFRVRAISGVRRSGYGTKSFGVLGTERPPAVLQNLRMHGYSGNKAVLSWDLSKDPDVLTGGSIHVRHTHIIGSGATWDSAAQVTDRLPGNATQAEVSLLSGTYLVKPVNASGFHSKTAGVVVSNMAGLIGYNRVVERNEPDSWPGVKNKAEVEVGGSLTLSEGSQILSIDINDDVWLYCGPAIPVDTSKTYRGTFRVRQTEDPSSGGRTVYAGLATLDENYNNLRGGAGTHRYFVISGRAINAADGWVEFEGSITGEGAGHNNFRPGTRYVRPMFIVNYRDGLGRADVDYLRFYDDEGNQLVDNDDFSKGKEGWSRNYSGVSVPDNAPGDIVVNPDPPFYIMDNPLDLGAVATVRVTMEVYSSVYFADTIDGRTTLIDSWGMFDGEIPDNVFLRYELSQTDDDPQSAAARWSDWTPFIKGEFRGRGFKLRVTLQGQAAGSVATISGLKLIADVQDRTEKGNNINAPSSGLRVNYQTPFLAPGSIAITAHTLPVNGRFELSNQDRFGFNIRFFSSNTAIATSFDYQSISYGEAQ